MISILYCYLDIYVIYKIECKSSYLFYLYVHFITYMFIFLILNVPGEQNYIQSGNVPFQILHPLVLFAI